MPDSDSLLAQGTVDFRDEGRRAANAGPETVKPAEPVRCYYDDCGPVVANDDQRITCPYCRQDMGLGPL